MSKRGWIEAVVILSLGLILVQVLRPLAKKHFFPIGEMIVCDDSIFYNAYSPDIGLELYRYDIKNKNIESYDLNKGKESSSPANFVKFNNDVFFSAKTGKKGTLMKIESCRNVSDYGAAYNILTSHPNFLTILDNKLFFVDKHPALGYETLYVDLNANSETKVLDVWPGAGFSHPSLLTTFNNSLMFNADAGNGGELFWYNPQADKNLVLLPQSDLINSCIIRDVELASGKRKLCFFKSAYLNNDMYIADVSFSVGGNNHNVNKIYYLSHFNSKIFFPSSTDIRKEQLAITDKIILHNRLLQSSFYVNYVDLTEIKDLKSDDVIKFTNIHYLENNLKKLGLGKYGKKSKEEKDLLERLRRENEERTKEVIIGDTKYSRINKGDLSPTIHESKISEASQQ